jgi:hypothetical protein
MGQKEVTLQKLLDYTAKAAAHITSMKQKINEKRGSVV